MKELTVTPSARETSDALDRLRRRSVTRELVSDRPEDSRRVANELIEALAAGGVRLGSTLEEIVRRKIDVAFTSYLLKVATAVHQEYVDLIKARVVESLDFTKGGRRR